MAALMLAAMFACSESHDVTDAASVRDGSRFDSALVDAPCPDGDGDGFDAASCGGDDCDDADPGIGPGSTRCDGPSAVSICEDGRFRSEPCRAGGVCDARTGSCGPDACGDGVVHPGEECDDANEVDGDGCAAGCMFEPCADSTVCPAHAPSCSDLRDDGQVYCRATIADGASLGTPCERDEECESGWCAEDQGACEAACTSDDHCGEHPRHVCSRVREWDQPRCVFGCFDDGDCPAGRGCVIGPTCPVSISLCLPGGTVPFAAECGGASARCASGLCIPDGCTRLCRTDMDCGDWACERFSTCVFPAHWPEREVYWCEPRRG